MLRIGLTGGIACGKSVVRRVFERRGARMLDADAVVHELLGPGGELAPAVLAEFGGRFGKESGAVNRAELGRLVFSDPEARERLNRLTHPVVRARIAAFLDGMQRADVQLAGAEASLLIEAGSAPLYDRIVVVHCPPAEQKRRLRARSRITAAEAEARIAAQMPIEEKMRLADHLVDASGTIEQTEERAAALCRDLFSIARRPRLS